MVPYSGGTAQIINDMMGKRVGLVLDAYSGIAGAVDAGNAVPLAVASTSRLAVSPNPARLRGGRLAGADGAARHARCHYPEGQCRRDQGDERSGNEKKLAALGRDNRSMSAAQTLSFIQGEQQKWAPVVQQIGPVK